MAAVRSAVHALHSASAQREPHGRLAAWARRGRARPATMRLGLVADLDEPASELIVGLLAQLRVATGQYVVELRAAGTPPEQMLVRVKELMCSVLMDEGWYDRNATRSLIAATVVWSIDAYYGL